MDWKIIVLAFLPILATLEWGELLVKGLDKRFHLGIVLGTLGSFLTYVVCCVIDCLIF